MCVNLRTKLQVPIIILTSFRQGGNFTPPLLQNESLKLSPRLGLKEKITGKTVDGGTKYVETMVILRYLSNFNRTLDMHLARCEINLFLTRSSECVLSNDAKTTTFKITDTKTLCSSCNFINSR